MLPPTVLDDVGPTCWPCLHGPLCIRKGVPGLTIAYLFPNMVSSCYFTSHSFDKTNNDLYYKMKYNNVRSPIIIGFNCAQG
jgi:hypothetical protein